mmetsp:Transcript_119394/g.337794  ORF Transcript_119394/g.337794 Transcript_119394/m.337794 type:complete len:228 (+) Transcript_119394:750-1433(+)
MLRAHVEPPDQMRSACSRRALGLPLRDIPPQRAQRALERKRPQLHVEGFPGYGQGAIRRLQGASGNFLHGDHLGALLVATLSALRACRSAGCAVPPRRRGLQADAVADTAGRRPRALQALPRRLGARRARTHGQGKGRVRGEDGEVHTRDSRASCGHSAGIRREQFVDGVAEASVGRPWPHSVGQGQTSWIRSRTFPRRHVPSPHVRADLGAHVRETHAAPHGPLCG